MNKLLIFALISVVCANHAFVTLLSDDSYLPGVLTLVRSAIVFGNAVNIPFHILCVKGDVSDRSIAIIHQYADKYHNDHEVTIAWIDKFDRSDSKCNQVNMGPDRFNNTFSKLAAFDSRNYHSRFNRVIYLDADSIITGECIIDLFSSQRYRTPAFAHDILLPDTFNTGVMLITPSDSIYYSLLAFAFHKDENGCDHLDKSYDGGDQGILNAFYRHEWTGEDGYHEGWNAKHHLSFRYNALAQVSILHAKEWNRIRPDICIVHFAGHVIKPFATEASAFMKKQAATSMLFMEQYYAWHMVYGSIDIPSKPTVNLLL